MTKQEAIQQLATLSKRQREVLELRCDGTDYKTISRQLTIGVPTVKYNMGRIYMKLGLHQLSSAERMKALMEIYCPALKEEALPVAPQEEAGQAPVLGSVAEMVENDEKALVPWNPGTLMAHQPPLIPVRDPHGRSASGSRRMLLLGGGGCVIGIIVLLLLAVVFWVGMNFGHGGPSVPLGQPTAVSGADTPEAPTETPVPTATTIPTAAPPTEIPASPTPLPTPTSLPDTPPGSILSVGDIWRQSGSELTLTAIEFKPSNDDNYGQLYTSWTYRNLRPQSIILSFGHTNFSAQTNQGITLKVLAFYSGSFWCDDVKIEVQAGELFDFTNMCGPGSSGYRLPIVVDLGNTQITDVVVTAKDISSITEAKWSIPILH